MINSYLTLKLSCLSQNKTQEIILSNIYMHFHETLEESGFFCLGWQKWDVLSRVKNQYGIFSPPRQISVGCFVHPGEVVWDLLATLQKMAWELLSMGSFVRLPFGITRQASRCWTVTVVTEFSIRSSRPLKILIIKKMCNVRTFVTHEYEIFLSILMLHTKK